MNSLRGEKAKFALLKQKNHYEGNGERDEFHHNSHTQACEM